MLVLVGLVIGLTLKRSDFLSIGQQQQLVESAAPLLVFATGMTVVAVMAAPLGPSPRCARRSRLMAGARCR